MPAFQNHAVDEGAFLSFLKSPSPLLIDAFITALTSDDQANSFFASDPPVWNEDPGGWVRQRLLSSDWYLDLVEPEAVAWHSAIDHIACEFDCSPVVLCLEHGSVDFGLFELAKDMFGADTPNRQILRMYPYRYHGLAAKIERVEPVDRIFWPTHAMLDVSQLKALAGDLAEFRTGLPDLPITNRYGFENVDDRRKDAYRESADLLGYVNRLIERKAMWFAAIDC